MRLQRVGYNLATKTTTTTTKVNKLSIIVNGTLNQDSLLQYQHFGLESFSLCRGLSWALKDV